MTAQKLGPFGVAARHHGDGRVRLEIWAEPAEGSEAAAEPALYCLTIPQALALMSELPVAVRAALKGMPA